MESHGTPGRIQITHATYELLADEFEFEPRGTIAVKGKGQIEAWYLLRRRCGRPAAASDGAPEPRLADQGTGGDRAMPGPRPTGS
jgi:class 3 adenylate cyclase